MKDMNTIQGYWDELMACPSYEDIPKDVKSTLQDMFYAGAIAMMTLLRKIDAQPGKAARKIMKREVEKEVMDFNLNKLKDRSPEEAAELLIKLLDRMIRKNS